ncbi:MAG: ABC transporter ATP-binding protein [Mesorhizobium sp.]|nr:MAG: ABC transporter ATP-binding protein [Mesorhizobium sp.]
MSNASHQNPALLDVTEVSKAFGSVEVLRSVSLQVTRGEVVTVIGPSGSGKTTLLRCVNFLESYDSGSIRIDGKEVGYRETGTRQRRSERDLAAMRAETGMVFQSFNLFPHLTAAGNIMLGLRKVRGKSNAEARTIAEHWLGRVGLAHKADSLPAELSGGQQQRVGVARALAAEPNVLLMDEPFGALDPIIRNKAQEDLLAIQKRFGTTIILVTHDMEEAVHMGDKIAVMDGGKVVQYAGPAEILAKPASAFVETLVGASEKPFRLLSLGRVRDAVEKGTAEGEAIPGDASQRDALAELLWSGRPALPVKDAEGKPLGRVTVDGLVKRAARPA